jgi:hypothetical protein
VSQHGNNRIFGSSIQLAEPEAEDRTFNYRRHVVDSDSPRKPKGVIREAKSAKKEIRTINLVDVAVSNDLKNWFTSTKHHEIPNKKDPARQRQSRNYANKSVEFRSKS